MMDLRVSGAELMELTRDLNREQRRTVAEELTEEELAVFDILTQGEVPLSAKDRTKVKQVAREMLEKLRDRLVIDWRKRQQTRAAVKLVVEKELDRLPEAFTAKIWQERVDNVYQHVYDSYPDAGRSVYDQRAA